MAWASLCTVRGKQRHTRGAFAAIVGDGSVVTAGQYMFGGDCSSVRDQLKDPGKGSQNACCTASTTRNTGTSKL